MQLWIVRFSTFAAQRQTFVRIDQDIGVFGD
jgi:hypothetical protein